LIADDHLAKVWRGMDREEEQIGPDWEAGAVPEGSAGIARLEQTRRSLLAKAGLVAGGIGIGTLAHPGAAEAATITGWINVKDAPYNATGDGTTNDRAVVQQAITDAQGGVCYFPPGTYLIGSPLRVSGNTVLRGCGRASILRAGPGNPDVILSNANLLAGDDNITIEYLEFDGNKANRSSSGSNIHFTTNDAGAQCRGITIHRVVSRDCGNIGITFVNCAEVEVSHCLVYNCAGGGPNFFWNCDHGRIHHNRIHSCNDDLIALSAEDVDGNGHTMRNFVIANNLLGPTSSRHIVILGAQECVVAGNVLDGGYQGIVVANHNNTPSSDIVIEGNVLQHSGEFNSSGGVGILVSAGYNTSSNGIAPISRVVIAGNLIDGPAKNGIEVQSTKAGGTIDDILIEGNQIRVDRTQSFLWPTGKGITVSPATDMIRGVVVDGNTIYNASQHGIVANGPNQQRLDIRDNTVYNSGQNTAAPGIYVSAVVDVSVIGNRCQDIQATKTQTFGVRLVNPTGDVQVIANDCIGNRDGPVSISGSAATSRLRIRDNPGFSPWTGQVTITGAWTGQAGAPPFTKQSAVITFPVPFPAAKPPRVFVTGEDVNGAGVAATVRNTDFIARLVAPADLGTGSHKASWIAEPDDD
jgi:hypothetical protein